MRGKSSSSKSRNVGVEFSKPEKMKEPKMSGAYIRSLVKQLSSSRTRDSSNLKQRENLDEVISGNHDLFSDKSEKLDQPQQRKKQVRRRLHTSRPYQERLLNMAEARREIVTALKYHRASMKQAREKQQEESRPEIDPFGLASSQSFPYNHPTSYLETFSSFSPGFCSPYSWPVTPIQENLNFVLPSQTLGLNLNLQDFNYLDSTTFHSSSIYSSSIYSSSSSTSSSNLSAAAEEISFVGPPNSEAAEVADSGLHPVMDDKEMAQIRSIGEQYQMEWNDSLNLVNSAWWFKFLKAMETSPEDQKGENSLNFSFEETVEFPAWMNANEIAFCSDDYVQDPALPCMDIEEIDGVDGEWLA